MRKWKLLKNGVEVANNESFFALVDMLRELSGIDYWQDGHGYLITSYKL